MVNVNVQFHILGIRAGSDLQISTTTFTALFAYLKVSHGTFVVAINVLQLANVYK